MNDSPKPPYDDDDEECREDARYLDFVAHQKEMAEKRTTTSAPLKVPEAVVDTEKSHHFAARMGQQLKVFVAILVVAGCIGAFALMYMDPPQEVRVYIQDPAQVAFAEEVGLPLTSVNSAGMSLRLIPPGKYMRGSEKDEPGHTKYEYLHEVKIPHAFYIAATETTQQQFSDVMGTNPSYFDKGEDYPVEYLTWEDAIRFCNQLSRNEGLVEAYIQTNEAWVCLLDREGYRLPVEAEWEYACRAGTDTALYVGDLDDPKHNDQLIARVAWNRDSSKATIQPVGQLEANSWGLYDMLGNVWEWCWDWHDYYPVNDDVNLLGPLYGDLKVIRGGGWYSKPLDCRAARRRPWNKDLPFNSLGFRVVRTVTGTQAGE